MTVTRPWRFATSIGFDAHSRDDIVAEARKAESMGFSTITVSDHFPIGFSPFQALLIAAEATETLRIGPFVIDNDFRHPAVLAKEAACIDLLSGGRFELGIGAGWLAAEYEQTGIPFDKPSVRIARLEESLQILEGLFGEGPVDFEGEHYSIKGLDGTPKPVQQPGPPILIGGGGQKILGVAGRHADIVSLAASAAGGHGINLADTSAEATLRKIEWVAEAAGDRFDDIELNVMSFGINYGADRKAAADEFLERMKSGPMPLGGETTADDLLESPHFLFGSPADMADQLLERRERFGISYMTVNNPGDEFGEVIDALTGT